MMKLKTVILLPAFLYFIIACTEKQNISQIVHIKQTRKEIKKILGDPLEIEMIKKSGKPIWGAEEEFWDEIPDNTILTLWKYKSDDGSLNLYFIGDDNHLAYKAFAPKGIVYESDN